MAVELILSGFFRSGTTILWEAARRANPDMQVFYEPCHEQLVAHVKHFERSGKSADVVHGRPLWDAYTHYPGLSEAIVGSRSSGSFVPTIDDAHRTIGTINDRVPTPTVIQVNRWGHLLRDLHERTKIPCVHIIRAPSDVQHSMRRFHERYGNLLERTIKRLAWPVVCRRAFSVHRRFQALAALGAIPQSLSRHRLSAEDEFLAVWLAENQPAVRTTGSRSFVTCAYEAILQSPSAFRENIREATGCDLDLDSTFTRDNLKPGVWAIDSKRLREFGDRYSVAHLVSPVLVLASRTVAITTTQDWDS